MKRVTQKTAYHGLSFPVTLITEIRNHVKTHPEYRSMSEFAREAVRDKLEKEKGRPDVLTKLDTIITILKERL